MDKSLFAPRRAVWSAIERSWTFRTLRTLEPIGVVLALLALIYTAAQFEGDRREQRENLAAQRQMLQALAWQTLDNARGKTFNAGATGTIGILRTAGVDDFGRIDLRDTWLVGANFGKVNLFKAKLLRANLGRANLIGADLTSVRLNGATLLDANLTKANLALADLTGAHLRRANLNGAYLGGARLNGANLTGADLRGAIVAASQLVEACGTPSFLPKFHTGLTLPPCPI